MSKRKVFAVVDGTVENGVHGDGWDRGINCTMLISCTAS